MPHWPTRMQETGRTCRRGRVEGDVSEGHPEAEEVDAVGVVFALEAPRAEAEVERRRAAVGLPSMEQYLKSLCSPATGER